MDCTKPKGLGKGFGLGGTSDCDSNGGHWICPPYGNPDAPCADSRTFGACCGASCVDCGKTGACVDGACQAAGADAIVTLAAPVDPPVSTLAVGDQYLYWLSSNSVVRAPKTGGAPEMLGDKGRKIAVRGGYAYWSSYLTASIVRIADTAGATPQTIAPATLPSAVAVDDAFVYWVDNNKQVLRAPVDGSSPPEIVGDPGNAITSEVFAVDGDYVFFDRVVSGGNYHLVRADKTGGGETILATAFTMGGAPLRAVASATRLVVATWSGAATTLVEVSKVDGSPVPGGLYAVNALNEEVYDMAFLGDDLVYEGGHGEYRYWTCARMPQIFRAGSGIPSPMAIDASYVYVARPGAILRSPL